LGKLKNQKIICGDSVKEVPKIGINIDYCITSPPYHNILQNNGQGLRAIKNNFRNGSRSGIDFYSKNKNDLGNQKNYKDFINLFQKIMGKVYKKLRNNGYTSIIISDFTIDKKEQNVQGDIVKAMEEVGFSFIGTIILLQNNKPLYPFGYPYDFKINHQHQNIINFKKRL